MAEVVYLKRGERPPRRGGSPFLLIVCRRRGGDAMQTGADGTIQIIRTTPEYIARNISSVRERLGESSQKIYVQGVPSRAEAEAKAKFGARCYPRPTIEDLQRESEISAAVGEKLRSTVQALAEFDVKSHENVSSSIGQLVADYLSVAPKDEYDQRRALEMLDQAMPKLTIGGAVHTSVMRIVLPSLLDAWKRDR
jgi:hypothetical protein